MNLQGIKKGIMEMADMVVINKADGDNVRMSEMARLQYQNALHIFPQSESGWEPVVTKASSTKNTGIDTVWEEISKYKQLVMKTAISAKTEIIKKYVGCTIILMKNLNTCFMVLKIFRANFLFLKKILFQMKYRP